jgi:hypothetical protein
MRSKVKKLVVLLTVIASILLCAIASQAAELQGVEIYPLNSLKAGTKGTGYTVIRGTTIETFDVEILELVPKGGFDGGPMILAKFSGPVVEHSKGIAGGYSGSPVYIGGKLVGAVSMAIPYTDTHVGGITPITSMLPALPENDRGNYEHNTVIPPPANSGATLDENGNIVGEPAGPDQSQPVEPHEHVDEVNPPEVQPHVPPGPVPSESGDQARVIELPSYADALAYNDAHRGTGSYAAVRASTPVLTSGISEQVMDKFRDQLQSKLGKNFTLETSGLGGSGAAAGEVGLLLAKGSKQSATPPGLFFSDKAQAPPLKPGAAVAVSLMQGDIEMNAIGTLTYSDPSGRFLIFGHPMLGIGRTNMPMGEAYVTWTHKSIERAFKDGVKVSTLGTLVQDRAAACGGSFNERADMVPVRVTIKDIDSGTEKELRFEVIRHPDYTPVLIAMGLAQASQQVLDRQLGGTMKLSYHIEGAGLKEPLRRTNYYSDDENVVFNGAFDIVPVANLLQTNIYRKVDITKVEMMVEITRNRVNASIDDAKIVWDKKDGAAEAAGNPPAIGEGEKLEGESESSEEGTGEVRQVSKYLRQLSRFLQQEQPAPQPQPQPGHPGQPQTTTTITGMPGMFGGMLPNMADMPTFAPGEDIKVRVRLQPFRTDPVWREFEINVPADFPSGSTMILVHGGGDLISGSEINGKGRNLMGMGPSIDVKEHDLDSIIDQVQGWPLNNELLLTLVRPFDPTQPQVLTTITPSVGPAPSAEKPEDKLDTKYQMEWVIYNGFMLPVNIMTKEEQAKAQQMKATMEQAQKDMKEGAVKAAADSKKNN